MQRSVAEGIQRWWIEEIKIYLVAKITRQIQEDGRCKRTARCSRINFNGIVKSLAYRCIQSVFRSVSLDSERFLLYGNNFRHFHHRSCASCSWRRDMFLVLIFSSPFAVKMSLGYVKRLIDLPYPFEMLAPLKSPVSIMTNVCVYAPTAWRGKYALENSYCTSQGRTVEDRPASRHNYRL